MPFIINREKTFLNYKQYFMGRSQETNSKKEIRKKKEKKRQDKEKKRLARKDNDKKNGLDDMIAYVDENGVISSTPPDPKKKDKTKPEDIEVSIPKRNAEDAIDPVRKGIVSFFNESKGFGFIKDSETKENIFFHLSNVMDELKEGNAVQFERIKSPKGPNAIHVKRI